MLRIDLQIIEKQAFQVDLLVFCVHQSFLRLSKRTVLVPVFFAHLLKLTYCVEINFRLLFETIPFYTLILFVIIPENLLEGGLLAKSS